MEGSTISAAPASVPSTPSGAVVRHRKVAVLGFGKTVADCPWKDDAWELWGMNGFWRAAEPDFGVKAPEDRYALWFDMHTIEYTRLYGQRAKFGDAQERWLELQHPFPILMVSEYPQFPSVQRFPIEELVRRVGRDYFTSTVAYMLAFALTQDNVAEVGLWGIDLIHDTEYSDQRPCAEYWIGRLEAAGIKVTIHDGSALLRQRVRYGYEPFNPMVEEFNDLLGKMVGTFDETIQKNRAERDRLTAQLHTDDGAFQICKQLRDRIEAWRRGGRIS